MRALLMIILAAAALSAAGCGATSTEPSDDDKALIGAVDASKQRLNALSASIDANELDDAADIDRYVRDMRGAADEFDTLGGTLERMTALEEARDEIAAYVRQLDTTAGLARALATAVEDGDEKAAERAETAYGKAAIGLSTTGAAVNEALQEAQ